MPKKELTEATMKRLKKHGEVHGKAHMNKMKRLMVEPPHHSFKSAHEKVQGAKDRLDESEGKKKGMKKMKQTKQDRLDEAEGKKRGKSRPMKKTGSSY